MEFLNSTSYLELLKIDFFHIISILIYIFNMDPKSNNTNNPNTQKNTYIRIPEDKSYIPQTNKIK